MADAAQNRGRGLPPTHAPMLLRHVSVLAGRDLEYVPDARVMISGGMIESVAPEGHAAGSAGREQGGGPRKIAATAGRGDAATATAAARNAVGVNCAGLLLIPGLVNCHTHIGDSVGKDARLTGTVDEKIHPVFGLKPRILSRTPPDTLVEFMRNSCISMVRGGITTFADFREGGVAGVRMLGRALEGVPIRCFAMGRTDNYHGPDEIRANAPLAERGSAELAILAQECDGIGLSGANENSDAALEEYSRCATLRAIHASETRESVERSEHVTGRSETARALVSRPHFLVHMTHASDRDLGAVAESGVRGIVVCPRANAALAEGVPDIIRLGSGSRRPLALGTDNVMVNPPDMFREMDYAWKMSMGARREQIEPAEILKMATVNAGYVLGANVGQIAAGMLADCVFIDKHHIDLEPMHSPHAAVVHRATQSSIKAVMKGGSIVYGGI